MIKGDKHNAAKLRDLGRGVGNHSRWSGGAHTGEVTAYLSLTVDKSSFEMKERGLLEEGIMCANAANGGTKGAPRRIV